MPARVEGRGGGELLEQLELAVAQVAAQAKPPPTLHVRDDLRPATLDDRGHDRVGRAEIDPDCLRRLELLVASSVIHSAKAGAETRDAGITHFT
jgi:hypothetical protein